MLEFQSEKCSACSQTLWGVVHFCPFCGKEVPAPEILQNLPEDAGTDPATVVEGSTDEVTESETSSAVTPPNKSKRRKQTAAKVLAKESIQEPIQDPIKEPVKEPIQNPIQDPIKEPVKEEDKEQPRRRVRPPDLVGSDESAPSSTKGAEGPDLKPEREKNKPGLLSRKSTWTIALLCGLGYWLWKPGPSGPDACDLALAQAQSSVQQQNAADAGLHSQAAIAACTDTERAGRAKVALADAQQLLKSQRQTQERAEQEALRLARQQTACENVNRQITGLLESARLESAFKKLASLDNACRQMGETQTVLAQMDAMQATAQKAVADARAQLESGALAQSRTSIEILASVNRESPLLAELRAALNKAEAAASRPAAVTASPQAELVRSFMRDAESHMKQRLYDKAKAFAESARRMDPHNPEIERLLKRIKADELAYMQKEIVIE